MNLKAYLQVQHLTAGNYHISNYRPMKDHPLHVTADQFPLLVSNVHETGPDTGGNDFANAGSGAATPVITIP